MANIDTENKRRSIIGIPPITIFPRPDGTIDAADRKHMMWFYRGPEIAVGGIGKRRGLLLGVYGT